MTISTQTVSHLSFGNAILPRTSSPWPTQGGCLPAQPAETGPQTWVRCRLMAQRGFMICRGCSVDSAQGDTWIQPLWRIFLCVYFRPELLKPCITAQVPLGVSGRVQRLNLQTNCASLWRSNYSALTDTNFKLQGLKLLHNPYCFYGSAILSHWEI